MASWSLSYCEAFAIAIVSHLLMHAPDGFLNAGTAVATGAVSLGTVGLALRQVKSRMEAWKVPLAGVTAAFLFAAQMFNFPVAAGTTGHLLGGALAAILLGPTMGVVVMTIVVVVQAVVFADGGLTALGYNVLNMAVVPGYGGYALFRLFRQVFPASTGGVIGSAGLAAWGSVLLASMAFSLEWLFGATVPVPFDTVFAAMVGVHLVIGLGEGVITSMALGAVLAARPDLVFGAADLDRAQLANRSPVRARTFVIGGILAALTLASVVSQFSFDAPDGLQSVADQIGLGEGSGAVLGEGLFAGYATAGVTNAAVSLAVAGIAGVLIVLAVGWGIAAAMQRPPRRGSRRSVSS